MAFLVNKHVFKLVPLSAMQDVDISDKKPSIADSDSALVASELKSMLNRLTRLEDRNTAIFCMLTGNTVLLGVLGLFFWMHTG